VLYHLRYPLLGLDIVAEKVERLLIVQTLTMPGEETVVPPDDLPIDERDALLASGWPKLAFIERRLAGDPTNWWAPNHAAVKAMLRSAGLEVIARPGHEIYVCTPTRLPPSVVAEIDAASGRV
jgi:tRNA (mo5U34)-methyltransferase